MTKALVFIHCIKQVNELRKKAVVFLCLVLSGLFAMHNATGQTKADTLKVNEYNKKAVKLMNAYRYDESIDTLRQALKIRDNALTNYYIGHIYSNKQEWDDAISYGEKAVRMDTSLMPAYFDLFLGYISVARWNDAKAISPKAKRGDNDHVLTSTIDSVDWLVTNGNRSTNAVIVLVLLLTAVFFTSFYFLSNGKMAGWDSSVRFSEIIIISASISYIFYAVFYHYSHWIWAQNQHVPLPEFATLVRMSSFEHDGIESTLLFLMVTANIGLTLIATSGILKLRKNKSLYLAVSITLLAIACYFFFSIGFYPPDPSIDPQYFFVPVILSALSIGLFILYRYNSLLSKLVVLALAAFSGLITLAPPSILDFNFILSPSLRLYHGFKFSEIYFQYDYFLSLLGYAWMKMNLSLDSFPYLFTFSFFLFYLASFFFSDNFFKTKGLSVIFIVALIIARLYLISHNTRVIPQVTPLRLDLWIILLLIAHIKGVHHWLLGVTIGLLVIFHRNMGILYLVAYVELLCVLFAMDAVALIQEKNFNMRSISDLVVKHLRLNAKNLVFIIGSVALCFVLFHELFSASATAYRKLGIGFLPIKKISFYWNYPIVLSSIFVFLMYLRKRLGEKYTTTTLFLLVLTITNSMYFFGRSHENNILNILGILVLTLYTLFDLLIFQASDEVVVTGPPAIAANTSTKNQSNSQNKDTKKTTVKKTETKRSYFNMRMAYLSLPVLFIFGMSYYYSERIYHKAEAQYNNLLESTYVYPFVAQLETMDTAAVRQITSNSPKVYFMDQMNDLYFYYYGKYVPQGYYSPFCAFVYKKDIITFVQGLLDSGYYIVFNNKEFSSYSEYIPSLKYYQQIQKRDIIALKKNNVPFLLPNNDKSIYHIALKDSLAAPGMDHEGLFIKDDATIEVILKPGSAVIGHGAIMNNLSQFQDEGLRGFTFQQSNAPNSYVFGFSNGTANAPNVVFTLDNNSWHYVVVTINKDIFRVYDNGKLLGEGNSGGALYLNSDIALVIGNRISRDAHYSGYIKEVNISNGQIEQEEIMRRYQQLSQGANNSTPNPTTK
jgi:hypothetical protein